MLLEVKSAQLRYGEVTVFSNVDLDVNEGERIGIVGSNGAGKSSLLNCIAGDLPLFDGSIVRRNGLTVGYLRQNCDFVSSNTLFDEMMTVFARQTALTEQIKEVSDLMSKQDPDGQRYGALADKYHRLIAEADATDAYNSEVKVRTVLNGMGMSEQSRQIVSTLSGGEKTKAALCKLLLGEPELMILDEPTNHLDYKTLDWLENFLSEKKSTLLVVSHDRYFLDRLCNGIREVSHGSVTAYRGNYTKYKQLRAERQKSQLAAYEKQQREIAKLTDYVARNKARASTADMAKSREKALERMTRTEAPSADDRPPRFDFSYTSEPSEFPVTVKGLTLNYGDKTLLDQGELQIRRGQKMALLGLNGVGKSTLIRRIAAQDAHDFGKIVFGKNVRIGYYDQENLNLDGNLRTLDQLWFDNVRMSQTEVRALLARVTLGAEDVNKLVRELSGGERARLGLAMLMAKDCNVLLLDEPTNHLDLPSREALEDALKAYAGTLIFVSHDRYFVNSVADCVAELSDGKLAVYEGNYDDFLSRKNSGGATPVEQYCKPVGTYRNARRRAEETNRARRLKQLEEQITELERQSAELNEQLYSPQIVSDYSKLSQVTEKLASVQSLLEQTLSEWEKLSEE